MSLQCTNNTLSQIPFLKVFEEDRVSESQLIQDIRFTRHRLELMFKVAHMNRDKTKLLVKTMDPGDPSEGTVSRPTRYNPQQILEIPMVREWNSNVDFDRAAKTCRPLRSLYMGQSHNASPKHCVTPQIP